MKFQDFITQFLLFLASISATTYHLLSNNDNTKVKRSVIFGKYVGAGVVAFFIMPGIMEYFNLTIKVTLVITVVIAYGLESLLKAVIRRGTKEIDNQNKDEDTIC